MYDQFDKKLSERIRYVFDTYEDNSADAGWKELRKTFPGKSSKPRLLYWISSAAAVILLCFGMWLFIKPGTKENIITKSHPSPAKPGGKGLDEKIAGSNELKQTEEAKTATVSLSEASNNASSKPVFARKTISTHPEINTSSSDSKMGASEEIAANNITIDSTANARIPVYAANAAENTAEKTAAPENSPALSTAERLAQIKDLHVQNKPVAKKTGRLSVGIFAGSFVNYSEGSKTSMNTGVGLLSELGISKKLKISTGVTLAQNTLKFDKVSQGKASEMLMAALPANDIQSSQELTNKFQTARTSSLSYSADGYDASLLGLDIPLNIKYMFFENKRELYMVAGLSSNFFIDESYTYKYETNGPYTGLAYNDNEQRETTTKTSSFDFARMLNLSVGFGYPVGKQSKLSFEPFVKYPLGGLGSQDIRFGSAGLNLKLNFSTK